MLPCLTQAKRRFLSTPVPRALRPHAICVGIAAILALCAGTAAAAAPAALDVSAEHARIRLLPADLPLAGYFDLVNHAKTPVTLVGASSTAFKMVYMHLSVEQGGVSKMLTIEGIELNPGQTVHFSPGGYHLMLMQRVKPLQLGDQVPITLKFSGDRSLTVMFKVQSAGGQ